MPPQKKKKRPTAKRTAPKERVEGRILVVDDEPDFCRMVGKALKQEGYKVDEAVTVRKAMALQRQHHYDLAVVDLRMPEMTGSEMLQYLKIKDKRIAVIVMTAYGSLQLGIALLRKGASDYLSKPFKLEALRGKVRDALVRRKRFLEEQGAYHDTADES